MLKQNKGITMIQMVVTVVMLALIAAFSIYNATTTVVEAKVAKAYNEIITLKNGVKSFVILNENLDNFPGREIPNLDGYAHLASENKPDQNYFYLDFKNDAGIINDALEVRNIENDYIVNLKEFENIEIFLVEPTDVNGEKVFTDNQIIEKYGDIFNN